MIYLASRCFPSACTHPTFQSPNCDRIVRTGQTVSHIVELGEPTVVQAKRGGNAEGEKILEINPPNGLNFRKFAHQKCTFHLVSKYDFVIKWQHLEIVQGDWMELCKTECGLSMQFFVQG